MKVGLLGGSFNPAHEGHRHISLEAIRRLGLDEVWWLVSPQNPLKSAEGMAPLAARLGSARRVARHPRIKPTAIETELGTRFAIDTVAALQRRWPHVRFVWVMGADNLLQFHRWKRWRALARRVPIAVVARPHYIGDSPFAPAMAWLRRFRHGPARVKQWTTWRLPAIVILPIRLSPLSATAIRARTPDWAKGLTQRT
ncbi:MAG: nicotinate-nucleotide adenylyltransferase [Alphaproteobacteria bacterium]|nr:nicotinate-nucleotide adenylyltransferase [Alphaproteobacteria bacterium]